MKRGLEKKVHFLLIDNQMEETGGPELAITEKAANKNDGMQLLDSNFITVLLNPLPSSWQ